MTAVTVGVVGVIRPTDELLTEYEALYQSTVVADGWREQLDRLALCVSLNLPLYERVGKLANGVPWYFIAAVHLRERNLSLKHHLHNGDSLLGRTVRHPPGRPVMGTPPFTWDQSAYDALVYQGLDKWTDWSLGGLLFQLEAYNGFGYRRKGMATPYLWSGTQHYTAGKYVEVKDPTGRWRSEFRPGLVDKQVGTAAFIRHLQDRKLITGEIKLHQS